MYNGRLLLLIKVKTKLKNVNLDTILKEVCIFAAKTEIMDYQFINITTYRGISSNAAHYYAMIGVPEYSQENLICQIGTRPETGVSFIEHEEMRYKPTYEEAKALYLKDHYNARDRELNDTDEDYIYEMVEDGTIRFPSILSIVKASKERFPESILCFCISGSSSEFARWMQRNKDSEQVKEIIEILL